MMGKTQRAPARSGAVFDLESRGMARRSDVEAAASDVARSAGLRARIWDSDGCLRVTLPSATPAEERFFTAAMESRGVRVGLVLDP